MKRIKRKVAIVAVFAMLAGIFSNISFTKVSAEEMPTCNATFTNADGGVESIDVYYTSDYTATTNASGAAIAVLGMPVSEATATARDSVTGELTVPEGGGQINFKVNLKEGYVVKSVSATAGTYKNLKNHATDPETIPEGFYRLTKVNADMVIDIETETAGSISTEGTPAPVEPYTANFVKDEGVASIDLYYTDDYSAANETDITSAKSRDGDTGELTTLDGQVNFKINLKEGYIVDSVTAAPTNMFKNLKGPADTGEVDTYRVTKINGDLEITITTKKGEALENVPFIATFKKDAGVESIDVYYTGNYEGEADEKNVPSTKSRNGDTGELTGLGGQINFKVNVKPGYVIKEVTASEGTYNKLKSNADDETIPVGFYRITKIKANLYVNIVTEADETQPTGAPITEPTGAPITEPTGAPITEPSSVPTTEPTPAPTTEPTAAPTAAPTPAAKEFNVTFVLGNGKTAVEKVKEGEKVSPMTGVNKKGYSFVGWYVGSASYDFNKAVTADITIQSKWKKISLAKTKITKASRKKGKLTVKFAKVKNAIGYEVKVGSNKSCTKASKTYTVTKTSLSKKWKKKGYVKVRAYAIDSTVSKVYSKWSTVKKFK